MTMTIRTTDCTDKAFCPSVSVDALRILSTLMSDLGYAKSSVRYLKKRVAHEGLSFLTRTLPALSKHILLCVENGAWSEFPFREYGVSPIQSSGRERYTAFIADELDLLFKDFQHPDNALNLWRIRQLCEYCYKLALPFDPKQLDSAAQKFLETDANLHYDSQFAQRVRIVAENTLKCAKQLTIADVVKKARYGPGTFSGPKLYSGLTTQSKKDMLDCRYPYDKPAFSGAYRSRTTSLFNAGNSFKLARYCVPFTGLAYLDFIKITGLFGQNYRMVAYANKRRLTGYKPPTTTSEVLFVPKDSRGPRVITREPAHNIIVQMGFFDAFHKALEDDTNGQIQFTSQEKFKELARESSKTRKYATLDLREASDSVSYGLAATVFQNFPSFKTTAKFFRTRIAKVGSTDRCVLRKLSGMGSGFTFPCMAAIIYCAILAGLPAWRRQSAKTLIYVYGDDIIVPTYLYDIAVRSLQLCGLTVNTSKSYYRSHFRESCGGDYYLGQSVSPVRLKQQGCNMRVQGTKVVSWSRFKGEQQANNSLFLFKLERHCRQLVLNGLISTAEYYYSVIERYIGPLPYGSGLTPFLCRYGLLSKPYMKTEHDMLESIPTYRAKVLTTRTCKAGVHRSFRAHLLSINEDIDDKSSLLFQDTLTFLRLERVSVHAIELT